MQRIIGESSTLATALDQVSLVAPLNRPILVIGERGTGKELIAERVHYLSPRWDQDYHKLNCAAISEQLLDSELFGHEAGAFTGATKIHRGRFERVDGGTLFFDELGTMPMRIQEKLLRLIEYGEFERLGGQKTLKVDVRIVAATNADLPELAKRGKFRHDLLDRLAFDVVNVPPLKRRLEDIPELVEYFAVRMCHELGWEYYSGFSGSSMNLLLDYAWPGNIRELKNVVERSIVRWGQQDEPVNEVILNPFTYNLDSAEEPPIPNQDDQCQTTDVKGEIYGETRSAPMSDELHTLNKSTDFEKQVREFEVNLIATALIACKHNQKATAEQLNITYHQLRALLKKYKNELPRR